MSRFGDRGGRPELGVKICGCRSWADATVAARAGATHVGFVFAPSPRRVSPADAAAIASEVRDAVTVVGVFVDAPVSEVRLVARRVGLAAVQLHGNERPDTCALLREEGVEVWKALRPRDAEELGEGIARYRGTADALLVEGFSPEAAGGTGTELPHAWLEGWRERFFGGDEAGEPEARGPAAREPGAGVPEPGAPEADHPAVAEPGPTPSAGVRPAGRPRLVLAGGLTPDNVVRAIRQVRPDAVDVSSGVERKLGEKDHDLIRVFVERARAGAAVGGPTGADRPEPPPESPDISSEPPSGPELSPDGETET